MTLVLLGALVLSAQTEPPVVRATERTAPPAWALMQRHLIGSMNDAAQEFYCGIQLRGVRKVRKALSAAYPDPGKAERGRQGTGRALFERVCQDNPFDTMTVNSSPYAVPIYHRLGFTDTDVEQVTNGLRYTPMICQIR